MGYEDNEYLEAWKKTVADVREEYAEEYDNPDFQLDYDSVDAMTALLVMFENDNLYLSECSQSEYEDICGIYASIKTRDGKSDLEGHGLLYSDLFDYGIVSKLKQNLQEAGMHIGLSNDGGPAI